MRWKPVNRGRLKSVWQRLIKEKCPRFYLLALSLRDVTCTLSIRVLRRRFFSLLPLVFALVLLSILSFKAEPVTQMTTKTMESGEIRPRVIELAKPSPFEERWGNYSKPEPERLEERLVKVETIRVRVLPQREEVESDTGTSRPIARVRDRSISKVRKSDICSRHNRRKVVYSRGKYKYWRCVR
jgi:hypothetical protein